jgi:hypothetical protein
MLQYSAVILRVHLRGYKKHLCRLNLQGKDCTELVYTFILNELFGPTSTRLPGFPLLTRLRAEVAPQ